MKNLFAPKYSKSIKTLLILILCSPFLLLQASPNWDANKSAQDRLDIKIALANNLILQKKTEKALALKIPQKNGLCL